ncbi:hypothetical protein [Lysobacter enzymogenes]|uniref:hypothetical protein n=1 Tax=Lysobacter enzymogenes TaxID=69 RepID=UPI001A97316C|nr:hypothetical protein [Lysobacter enzymogenes]QQP97855.1 hypothetical protein JHW38_07540 [Lysobacter enzymogenes]
MTVWHKRAFPAIWFGLLAVYFFFAVRHRPLQLVPVALAPALMLFGFFVMRAYVWDLADEVLDDGDRLVVRKGALEQALFLRDVVEVRITRNSDPTRLTLVLAAPGVLGDKIVFAPAFAAASLVPFSRHPLAKELEDRIATLKNNR